MPLLTQSTARLRLTVLLLVVFIFSIACRMPTLFGRSPQVSQDLLPNATPTTPPEPLPPALVETSPQPGGEIPLTSAITLIFNQPMDRNSVEAAFNAGGTAGRFEWQNDAALTFQPDAPLLPDSNLNLTISVTAQSQRGMPLHRPVNLTFRTAGTLQLVQKLPEDGQVDTNPGSAVVAAFNQPVVPLGADPDSTPSAFELEPAASGRGEWINTSTYIFYPDPPLTGGLAYTARVNASLTSAAGAPLQDAVSSWSFQVSLPEVISASPEEPIGVPLDAPVQLQFNQAMNSVVTLNAFSLRTEDGDLVLGESAWDESFTTLTYTPATLLARSTTYQVNLEPQAQSAGGASIPMPYQSTFTTIGSFSLVNSDPPNGGTLLNQRSMQLVFNAPLPETGLEPYFKFEPAVENMQIFLDQYSTNLLQGQYALRINADFIPNTSYLLTIGPAFSDHYGGALGGTVRLPFRTAPLEPRLENPGGGQILYLTTQDTGLSVQLTNLFNLPLSLHQVSAGDFLALVGPGGYDLRQNYQTDTPTTWSADFDIPPDRSTRVQIPLTPQRGSLRPGIYLLRVGLSNDIAYANNFVLVVSDVHLTYKTSATDTLVWAMNTRTNQPVANAPVVIFDENAEILVSGVTGEDGVFHTGLPRSLPPYDASTVMMGQPGEPLFSAAVSVWNQGLDPFSFDIRTDYSGPRLLTYIYTDRPIYRPGQTVYFRAITRYQNNGRYSLPTETPILPVKVYDGQGTELASYDLSYSAFGTVHGEFDLFDSAQPGFYRLEAGENAVAFQVAEYRKPEIDLDVVFDQSDILAGEDLSAVVNARYFFDAPAGDVSLDWVLYEAPDSFRIPNYQTGLTDNRWLYGGYYNFYRDVGVPIAQGSAQTGADGSLQLELPNPAVSERLGRATRQLTLEVTAQDESGLPVSARESIQVHPAVYYIGIRPDIWAGQAGQETGYSVLTTGWDTLPAGSRPLTAAFSQVTYARVDPPSDRPYDYPTYEPAYTSISSVDFATGTDGMARLVFTAPKPGTYQLKISGDGGAETEILIWFGGPGQTIWPNLPNQRLRLTLDRETYKPGDTAQVFVPNPFPNAVTALLTVERGLIMRYELHRLSPGGASLAVPLSDEDAPNVYVSVTILGEDENGQPDFRLGYTDLEVIPIRQTLNVELIGQPERAGPGDEVTFTLRVTDETNSPVQGEFSLAVVDKAVLALADTFAPLIEPAFYGEQYLGVRTNLSLAGYGNRFAFIEGGLGGGGGGDALPPAVRQEFPDTAYWHAEIVTDANGEAVITVPLPDSLTTWQVDVRGLTADTRVGGIQLEIVTSKDVLIRPVTPRFLVTGDHALLAAVVQNNTDTDLNAQVNLEAGGFALDEGQEAAQQVPLPAGGRVRVEWWGTALDVESARLVFSVQAGEFEDAALPNAGALPVLRYTASQAFATASYLEGAVQQLELVSLPAGALHDAGSKGKLQLELAPSLAAALLTSLDALEIYEYSGTEQVLARFLPNLLLHHALQTFSIELPEVENRLERTLQPGIAQLLARQNLDGGWGWWSGGQVDSVSSPYITAYVLFGLSQARETGVNVSQDSIQRAIDYLTSLQADPGQVNRPYFLDRLVFQQFALAQAGAPDTAAALALYASRDQLSPWAQALLAFAIDAGAPDSLEAEDLLATLQTEAQRSATGAFWSDPSPRWQNLNTTVTTTAMVVYTLSLKEPASTLLPDAIRFIMAGRGAQGYWASTYETTWALLATTAYMQGTGELGGDYDFQATLNSAPLASGSAGGDTRLTPVIASAPVSSLYPNDPNALRIERTAGAGRLYYTALLDVAFPADLAAPLTSGLSVSRSIIDPNNCTRENCPVISSGAVGTQVDVRLTLTVPQDAYHVLIEDFFPAGAEILDRTLKTSQLGDPLFDEAEPEPLYDPGDPFSQGWGWWYFGQPLVFDDHIAWTVDYLAPGTYELVYTLTLLQPGDFRILPAHARQRYFPEIQGTSPGAIFTIKP